MKRRTGILFFLTLILAFMTVGCSKKEVVEEGESEAAAETEEITKEESEEETGEAAKGIRTQQTEEEAEEETESAPADDFTPVSDTVTAIKNVNIRKEPSTFAESAGVLLAGESLLRNAVSEEWSQVLYEGETCYIATQYLTEDEPEQAEEETGEGLSEAVVPAYSSDVEGLDNTTVNWGYSVESRDEYNRPVDAVNANETYHDYHADFLKENTNTIYLTFDEGYEYGYTEEILDILEEKNVKAVFFLTQSYAEAEPGLVERMIKDGHVLGNHSSSHPADGLPSLGARGTYDDLLNLHNYILTTYDYDMYLFRPPEGEFSLQTLAVADELGYRSVLWSFAYKDWDVDNQPDVAESLARCIDQLHPGAIYLLHAVSSTNTALLSDFIDHARAEGYTFGIYTKTS